jgi:hypothetical protein
LLKGPDSYSRRAEGAVINPDTRTFCLTGLLERANCRRTNRGLVRGSPEILAAAKAVLCRRLGAVHLDGWELDKKPIWTDLREILRAIAMEGGEAG